MTVPYSMELGGINTMKWRQKMEATTPIEKKITPERIRKAMENLGGRYKLSTGTFFTEELNCQRRVCPIGAIGCDELEEGPEIFGPTLFIKHADKLYGKNYTSGFVHGFDRLPEDVRLTNFSEASTNWVEYRRGVWDGWICALELEPEEY